MKIHVAVAAAAMILVGAAMAKDKVVVVPAHPDDLIPCFGMCLKSKDVFEWHVIEFTHGERGLGEQGYRDGSTKEIRMAEEGAVCKELGAQLKAKKAELKALIKEKEAALAAAAEKKAEEEKAKLLDALAKSGKSIDEIIEFLGK